jgi:hypothetical protein
VFLYFPFTENSDFELYSQHQKKKLIQESRLQAIPIDYSVDSEYKSDYDHDPKS